MKLMRVLFLLFCFLLPLTFNLQNADSPFELFKFFFSVTSISIMAVIFLVWIIRKKIILFEVSTGTLLIFLIGAINIISYIFSVNPYLSFWGDSLLPSDSLSSVLVFAFAAFVAEQIFKNDNTPVVRALLLALAIEVVYGLLQSFGYDFYSWNYAKPVFGTFGSTVSFATYIGCLVPLTICYFFESKNVLLKSALFALVIFSDYLLIETGSRTPAFVAFFIQLAVLVNLSRRSEVNWRPIALMGISILMVFSLAFLKPNEKETLKYKFSSQEVERGLEVRMLLWRDGIAAWKEHPFLGYGPETFSIAQRAFHSKEMNQNKRWHSAWTKAHNQFIHYLVSIGVFGLLAHLLLLGFVVRTAVLNTIRPGKDRILSVGYAGGFIFLVLANLTGFNFITTEFFYYFFPVLMLATSGEKPWSLNFKKIKIGFYSLVAALILLFLLLGTKAFNHFRGDLLYQMSYSALNKNQDMQLASLLAEEAIKANSLEPAYYCHMSQITTQLLIEAKNVSDEVKGYLKNNMSDEAELCKQTAVNRDFYFLQVGNQFGQLYSSGLLATPEKSLQNYETLMTLAPNVPLGYYRSALIYYKAADFTSFERNMERALELKNNYLPAYLELFRYYYGHHLKEKKDVLLERFLTMEKIPTELQEMTKTMADIAEQNNDHEAKQIFLKKFSEFTEVKK